MKIRIVNHDIVYLILFQGVNYVIPLLILPYLIIHLGARSYGYLGFSQSVIQYFLLIVDFGFNLSATQRIAKNRDNKSEISRIFYATLYAKIILLIIATLIFPIVLLIPQFANYRSTLLMTYPTLLGTTFTFFWLFQGIGKVRLITFFSLIPKLLLLPLLFFVVNNENDYLIAAFIQSITYVLTAILSIYWLIKNRVVERFKISINEIRREVKESFPLFLSAASISMYTQLFTVFLGLIATPEVVGKYSAAEKIVRSLCFLIYVPFSQYFFPKISELAEKDRRSGVTLFRKTFKQLIAVMFFICVIIMIASNKIALFLGKQYSDISILLIIMSVLPIIIVTGGFFGQMGLIALGNNKTKNQFKQVYFLAALFSLICVIALSTLLAEKGASIALVMTELFVAVLMVYFTFKNNIIKTL